MNVWGRKLPGQRGQGVQLRSTSFTCFWHASGTTRGAERLPLGQAAGDAATRGLRHEVGVGSSGGGCAADGGCLEWTAADMPSVRGALPSVAHRWASFRTSRRGGRVSISRTVPARCAQRWC